MSLNAICTLSYICRVDTYGNKVQHLLFSIYCAHRNCYIYLLCSSVSCRTYIYIRMCANYKLVAKSLAPNSRLRIFNLWKRYFPQIRKPVHTDTRMYIC